MLFNLFKTSISYLQKVACIQGIPVKTQPVRQMLMKQSVHEITRCKLFQQHKALHILKAMHLHLIAQGAQRRVILSRIDYEGIARGERQPAVRYAIGIDGLHRILAVIKVIAPMQESLDVVQVHQDSHDAVSAAWHGEESIGNLDTLGDTVIHPKICNVVVQKRLDMVARTHWVFHHLVGIKLKIRQSVHDNTAVKEIGNLCFGFQVVGKLV